jgi:xanthine/uracil permease
VAIPSAVLGGMTTFLFTAVAVSGMAIVARGVPFTRRSRFVLTAGLALGYGATLVPTYFDRVFAAVGDDNRALRGFLDAISLVMETGFAVTAAVCVVLNLSLPAELEDGDMGGVEVAGSEGAAATSAPAAGVEMGTLGECGEVKGGKMA